MEEAGQFNEHEHPPEGFVSYHPEIRQQGEVARVEAAAKGYLQGDFA